MSNVPASRRAVLAGFIAAPVASASLTLPATTAPHPDAALFVIAATIPNLVERRSALVREHGRIEAACFEWAGPAPEKPRCHPAVFPDFQDFDRAMDAWQVELKARDARLVAAGEALGLDRVEDACLAADDALIEACESLAAIRATTLQGLAAKTRAGELRQLPALRASIVADLLAMGGQI